MVSSQPKRLRSRLSSGTLGGFEFFLPRGRSWLSPEVSGSSAEPFGSLCMLEWILKTGTDRPLTHALRLTGGLSLAGVVPEMCSRDLPGIPASPIAVGGDICWRRVACFSHQKKEIRVGTDRIKGCRLLVAAALLNGGVTLSVLGQMRL